MTSAIWPGEGECLQLRGVCVCGTRSTGGVSSADDVRVASVLCEV